MDIAQIGHLKKNTFHRQRIFYIEIEYFPRCFSIFQNRHSNRSAPVPYLSLTFVACGVTQPNNDFLFQVVLGNKFLPYFMGKNDSVNEMSYKLASFLYFLWKLDQFAYSGATTIMSTTIVINPNEFAPGMWGSSPGLVQPYTLRSPIISCLIMDCAHPAVAIAWRALPVSYKIILGAPSPPRY